MKTILFVPGHTENLESRDYKGVMKAIAAKGYKVRFVPINWRYTYVDKWVDELESIYNQYKAENVILAGFSYGAITALLAAAKRSPTELWLFSLSPYFKEDMPAVKDAWKKAIGKRKIAALSRIRFLDLAPLIHCRTLVFLGTEEAGKYPASAYRAEEAAATIRNSRLVYVNGVGHDVSDSRYIAAIKASI